MNTSIRGEFIRTKLTKSLLYSLPNGACVVSNCFLTRTQSIFVVQLEEAIDRQRVWAFAVKRKASQRYCWAFWHKENFESWAGAPMTVPEADL
jgi:hypothetical protein